MELEELKHIWTQHHATELETLRLSEAEIQAMLRRRSLKALGKINRNMLIEAGVILILGLVGIVISLTLPHVFSAMEQILLFVYVVLSIWYYAYKYRVLNQIGLAHINLRVSLSRLTQVMGRFMSLYTAIVSIGIPILASSSMFYGILKAKAFDWSAFVGLPLRNWAIYIGAMLIYSLIAYLVSRYYIRKLYGVHYQELRRCWEELEELSE